MKASQRPWRRYLKYRAANGVVEPDFDSTFESYYPMQRPEMLVDLLNSVRDGRTALEFIQRWGGLYGGGDSARGLILLISREQHRRYLGCRPHSVLPTTSLKQLIGLAETMRALVDLLWSGRDGDIAVAKSIERLVGPKDSGSVAAKYPKWFPLRLRPGAWMKASAGKDDDKPINDYLRKSGTARGSCRVNDGVEEWQPWVTQYRILTANPDEGAIALVTWILTHNLRTRTFQVEYSRESNRLELNVAWQNLPDVLWSHLANAFTLVAAAILKCPGCDTYFSKGDPRQTYCSERCGNRDRQRRLRTSAKENKQGETKCREA